MRRVTYSLVALAALAALAAGCRDEPRQAEAVQPDWVVAGVDHVRSSFVGNPAPADVTWGESGQTRWVSVDFGERHLCSGCSHPSSVGPIRLTGATVHFAPHSTRVTTFTGKD